MSNLSLSFREAPEHGRQRTIHETLHMLYGQTKSPVILEIGSSIEHNPRNLGNLTLLFSWVCDQYGGDFITCDVRTDTCLFVSALIEKYLGKVPTSTRIFQMSGLQIANVLQQKVDLLYLDAMDEDYADYLQENDHNNFWYLRVFQILKDHLSSNAMVLIDDTWKGKLRFEGKGKLLTPFLINMGWKMYFGTLDNPYPQVLLVAP